MPLPEYRFVEVIAASDFTFLTHPGFDPRP